MTDVNTFLLKLNELPCSEACRHGLHHYMLFGVMPGSFLQALLSNDLKGTFFRADSDNVRIVDKYLMLLYNHAPGGSWGSEKNFTAWVNRGGWLGHREPPEQEPES